MSLIDIIILAVFACSILFGLKMGFIRQLGSIAAIVLGLLFARIFSPAVSGIFSSMMPESLDESPAGVYSAEVFGAVLIFLVVYFVVLYISKALKLVSHVMLLGLPDRILGAVFGLLQWSVGLGILLNFWAAASPDSEFLQNSALGNGLALKAVMGLGSWLMGTIHAPWIS